MASCRECREPIIFAVVSNQEGRPPGRMPLNPRPDPAGNVACYFDVNKTLVGHVLTKGETPPGYQKLYMPHFATCQPVHPQVAIARLPEGVTGIDAWRKARAANARQKRRGRSQRAGPTVTGYRVARPRRRDGGGQ